PAGPAGRIRVPLKLGPAALHERGQGDAVKGDAAALEFLLQGGEEVGWPSDDRSPVSRLPLLAGRQPGHLDCRDDTQKQPGSGPSTCAAVYFRSRAYSLPSSEP